MDIPSSLSRGVLRSDAPQRAHYGRIFDIAFCPWDDRLFASASEDETARVWCDDGSGCGASSTADGDAAGGHGRGLRGGGVTAHGVCRGHKDEVVRVAWHPTLKLLATGSADGTAGVWRVAQPGVEEAASAHDPRAGTVARVDSLEGHPGEVYGCVFVGDGGGAGPVLATASGADLHLWDLEAGRLVARVPPPEGGGEGMGAEVRMEGGGRGGGGLGVVGESGDGDGDGDGAAGVGDGEDAAGGRDDDGGGGGGGGGGGAGTEAMDPGDDDGGASSGGCVPERWRPGYLFSLSSDGGARGVLASACSDGSVRLWGHDSSARSARAIATLPLHPGSLAASTAFLSGGDVLASLSTDGVVVLTDVRTMTPLRKVTSPSPLMGCCAVPSSSSSSSSSSGHAAAAAGGGGWLAMCGRDGSVRAMRASGVGGTKMLKPSSAAAAAAAGGGGRRTSGENHAASRAPPPPLLCVAADASGRRIAAAGHAAPAPVPLAGLGGSRAGGLGGGGFLLTAHKAQNDRPAGIHLWEASSV